MLTEKKSDKLEDRLKRYEHLQRTFLKDKGYFMIRIDGRHFKTYTKHLKKPFDDDLVEAFDYITLHLCKSIPNCIFGYTQSDEISLIFADVNEKTQKTFGGNISKIVSTTAAEATGEFFRIRAQQDFVKSSFKESLIKFASEILDTKSITPDILDKYDALIKKESLLKLNNVTLGTFDARVSTITEEIVKNEYEASIENLDLKHLKAKTKFEVYNYLLWRWDDCVRNSKSAFAQSFFKSQSQLHKKNTSEMVAMCLEKGHDWNALDDGLKYGRFCFKEKIVITVDNPNTDMTTVTRNKWSISKGVDLYKDNNKNRILDLIPDLI